MRDFAFNDKFRFVKMIISRKLPVEALTREQIIYIFCSIVILYFFEKLNKLRLKMFFNN